MADNPAAMAKPKASKPITTKHLAATLAEQHQLTKKQGQQMLEDLVGLITNHLKRGERVKMAAASRRCVARRVSPEAFPGRRRQSSSRGRAELARIAS